MRAYLGSAYTVWLVIAMLSLVSNAMGADHLTVYVVNYPLQYFAERIAGEQATVVLPAPADADPAFWMPDVETITAYQRADLIVLHGAGYAKWLSKVSLPQFRQVDTSAGFKDRYIKLTNVLTHTHGPTGEHAHAGVAFTTWLDFDLAVRHARAIAAALSRKRPALRETFQRRYAALKRDLMLLDRDMQRIVASRPPQPLIASHPVYDYLAQRYGLHIKSLHWEPDAMPSEAQWAALRHMLTVHPAPWMLWEGEPMPALVARLISMGIQSIVFDPCANVPERGALWKGQR